MIPIACLIVIGFKLKARIIEFEMLPNNIKEQIADRVIRLLAPLVILAGVVAIIFVVLISPEQLQRIIPLCSLSFLLREHG